MKSPTVSVLVPLYNKAPWLLSTIESVLRQTHRDLELVIIDDGSTDGSAALVESLNDERIRFWSRENRGANVTRNELLEAARGKYIQFLDADDLLLPHKLALQVESLEAGASVSIGQVSLNEIDGPRQPQATDDPLEEVVIWHGVPTPGPLHRKTTLEAVGGWAPDLPASQEYDLHLRLLLGGHWDQVSFTDEVLAIWRLVPGSTTSDELRVYRSKISALTACDADARTSARPIVGRSLANAARHLARSGEFAEAEAAFRTAIDVDPNSVTQYPGRIRWIHSPAGLQRAEWLDSRLRRMLSRGGSTDG